MYLAIGVDREGRKDVLGLWIEQTEGAAFWLRVMTELKSRGVEDILIALVDGLAGFPEAITTVFPQTQVHHCVVHLVRGSLSYVSYKDRKAVGAALRGIYRAPTEDAALAALAAFEASPWGTRYAPIGTMWRRHWAHVRPVFAYPPEIRKLLYTTNAIESLERQAATGGAGQEAISRATRRRPSSFSWSCARSLSNGKCRLANGPRQRPSSPSCSAIASSELDGNPAPRTRFRTLPLPLRVMMISPPLFRDRNSGRPL